MRKVDEVDDRRAVLSQVNIVVRDMEASVRFYRLLGVDISDTLSEWMPHHRTIASVASGLDGDLDSAAFAATWDRGWPPGRRGVVVSFVVPTREAVDAVHDAVVAAGYPTQQAPYDAFWGARYAVVEDPDGLAIGIASPIDEDRRGAPPTPPP